MDLKVRKAELRDLDELVKFAREEAREAEGIKKVPQTLRKGIKAALMDNNKGIYWVLVTVDDQPVGNISALKEWSNWNAGYYWWIQSLYIAPEFRGQGYLGRLFNTVIEEMKTQGGLDLRLYVNRGNARAIRAYEKLGFKKSKYEIMIYDPQNGD